jgi:uncharacterized protein
MRVAQLLLILWLTIVPVAAAQDAQPSAALAATPQSAPSQPVFAYKEVMIPVRDGVHLQTVILTPSNFSKPLPILFRRTPYGVPGRAPEKIPAS